MSRSAPVGVNERISIRNGHEAKSEKQPGTSESGAKSEKPHMSSEREVKIEKHPMTSEPRHAYADLTTRAREQV